METKTFTTVRFFQSNSNILIKPCYFSFVGGWIQPSCKNHQRQRVPCRWLPCRSGSQLYSAICLWNVNSLWPNRIGPAELKGPFDSTGFPVGCKSACEANLDGNQGKHEKIGNGDTWKTLMVRYLANSPNCCSGQFNTPETCPSSGACIIVNKQYWMDLSVPCDRCRILQLLQG